MTWISIDLLILKMYWVFESFNVAILRDELSNIHDGCKTNLGQPDWANFLILTNALFLVS